MPRNSDFPDYKGIKVQHVNDWDPVEYHKPSSQQAKERHPFIRLSACLRDGQSPRSRRVHNLPAQSRHNRQTSKAAQKDWRTERNLRQRNY